MTKLEEAIVFTVNAHTGAKRKGSDMPYILHPLEVMTIVASMTDDEDVMAAAVLHDTVEDTDVSLEDVEEKFGPRIAGLVASETENKREDQPAENTWRIRKQEAIDHLRTSRLEAKMRCRGDKLSNLRQMARDHAALGETLWERFNQIDKTQHAWYYCTLYEIISKEFQNDLKTEEYRRLLKTMYGCANDTKQLATRTV